MAYGEETMVLSGAERDSWLQYYQAVYSDYHELKKQYPYCYLSIPPTVKPVRASIVVIAVDSELVEAVRGAEDDFKGSYSKELFIDVPMNYKEDGCIVYGAEWLDYKKLDQQDIHFYPNKHKEHYGYELCLGTPESFKLMNNVILENVRSASMLLVAYEKLMTGYSDHLDLIAYSHGDEGREQFVNNRHKYIPRK